MHDERTHARRDRQTVDGLPTKITVTCFVCGTSFVRYRRHLVNPDQPACSRECAAITRRHGSTLHCVLCDTPFYRRFGEQDREIRVNQFCSRDCYMEWRRVYSKPGTYLKVGPKHIHRIVAEGVLGRPLTSEEVVHHIDEDKQNNDPANLCVFPDQAHHARCHFGSMSDDELRRFSLAEVASREARGVRSDPPDESPPL